MVGRDHRDIHAGRIGELAVGADQGRSVESAGGHDIQGVVDGEVVAQPPGLDEEWGNRHDRQGPIGEDLYELFGTLVIEDAGKGVSADHFGDFDVKVLHGPEFRFFVVVSGRVELTTGLGRR